MAGIHEVAREFTALLQAGRFEAAADRFWAPDVISTEPGAPGIAAARHKRSTRFAAARIEEIGIDGPFVTGDQFALFLDLVVVDPASGSRQPFSEIALYTVRDGQIAEERYFYD